ncbi:MAG: penicillin-binding transpeptidase domain-containing protein, partial [Pseudomonadota bacterium]
QVGVSRIALKLGHGPIRDVFARLGLGQPTGTTFPGENGGMLPDRIKWHPTEQVTLAYGYGLTVTPLQIARAYTAFANGGVLRPVSMLALDEVPEGHRVMDAHIADKVMQVLHEVTGDNGTGSRARVPGYRVGGKTGTVHKVGPGGYLDDKYVALFAGVAPAEDPRVVTVVVIDQPKGDAYGGGAAAAPVFSRVASGVLRLLDIAPRTGQSVAERESSAGKGAA